MYNKNKIVCIIPARGGSKGIPNKNTVLIAGKPLILWTTEQATGSKYIDEVYVYGKHIKETYNNLNANKKGKIFNNLKQAYDHFGKILHNNDTLMVKGSNATGLSSFSKKIKKGQISVI